MLPHVPIARGGVVAAFTLLTLAVAALAGAVTIASQSVDTAGSILASDDGHPEELWGFDWLMLLVEAQSSGNSESKGLEQLRQTAPEPATALTLGLGLSLLARQAQRIGRVPRARSRPPSRRSGTR